MSDGVSRCVGCCLIAVYCILSVSVIARVAEGVSDEFLLVESALETPCTD